MVLDEIGREYRAGSAGSPAANVVACGSSATIVGALGDDLPGGQLSESLAQLGIGCEALVRHPGFATSVKTRILGQGFTGGLHGRQHMLRLDRVTPLPPEAELACAERLTHLAGGYDAILLSDYRAGVVSDSAIEAARASGKPVAVDSQGNLRRFRGLNLVKANQADAEQVLGGIDVLEGGHALRAELEVDTLVVTLGARGMAVFEGSGTHVVPGRQVTEVFDVTGAGDTVIAVLTLGLIAGLPMTAAAVLANAAASVVVRRLGVATATPAEIAAALGAD